MTDLGTLGGNTEATQAFAINNAGHIAGTSPPAGGFPHAVLWRDDEIVDLGTLGGTDSYAYGINRFDQIVGTSDTLPPRFSLFFHAFLWERDRLSDLNTRVINLPPDVTLQFANAINDRGQIAGQSCAGADCESGFGVSHAFLLVPNP
jgi:probable HAF family extracellular repeat protein